MSGNTRGMEPNPSSTRRSSKRNRREVEQGEVEEELGVEEREDHHQYQRHRRKKRRRARSTNFTTSTIATAAATTNFSSSALVLVSGLPAGCTVLELKSRFEIYGAISRTRMEGCSGFITFRSPNSAQAAVSAALDPAFGITLRSKRVHVCPVSDPLLGAGISPSKLLRAEIPLSKHGRSNKKINVGAAVSQRLPNLPFKGREIVAYDDLL